MVMTITNAFEDLFELKTLMDHLVSLIDRKFISCKILQVSCKLRTSCKIFTKNQFLQDSWMQWHSCKVPARILQDVPNLQEYCKILREINFLLHITFW